MLPLPSSLSTWISPPSRRAISRLIDSPRPVPPYLRLVVPSACWNASKMSCCLSRGDADAGVDDREADHAAAGGSVSFAKRVPRLGAGARAASPSRASVNLKALASRFFRICCSRCGSVRMRGGSSTSTLDRRTPGPSARRAAGRCARRSRATSAQRDVARLDRHLAGLDLGQVEDLVDQRQQVAARRVDRLRVLDLLVGEVAAPGCRTSSLARMSRLLSGVRSSCDMFARNSDLYLEISASCSAFSSSDSAGLLDLAVLDLDLRVLLVEQPRLLLQLERLLLQRGVGALELVLLLRAAPSTATAAPGSAPATAAAAPRCACWR